MTKTITHFFLVILSLSGLSLQAQKRILYNLQVTYPDGLKKNSTVYLDINNDKVNFYEAKFITPGQKPSGLVQAIERKSGTSENTILVQDFTKMTKDFQAMIRKNLPPYVEADKDFLLNKTN
ncbi:hypothetical protein OZ664_06775 [Elizabethkingia sp. HX WHF]|uniref:hypothetical protein n=1 Tax=Elizabethkingia TaxID=308865 RepID=UPI0009998682|nr:MULTISPECIES: hypothetical protein [Elizabethkingia]ATL42526.1 hypothetical protein CQS02_04010 [Elizabethkingia miricola]MCL1637065.1 hypothetical protein [Elizabethkingia bruuniana]MDX8563700.1 hypothetical protein [Elizabethkingia sp. HX WHF]OPC20145.1 hypothetical protein BAY00_11685 [Elizabethkingia bruuniana]